MAHHSHSTSIYKHSKNPSINAYTGWKDKKRKKQTAATSMAFSPPVQSLLHEKEELKYLHGIDNVKHHNNADMSNFYLTQPLSPLDGKLSTDMMVTYCAKPDDKLTCLFSPQNLHPPIKKEKRR